MTLFPRLILATTAAVTLTASIASAEVWTCEFKDAGRHNTIPQKVLFDVRPDGSVLVMDPFLVHVDQAPKKAKFAKNTSDKLRVRWRVDDVPFSGGLASDMDFSVTHDKARGKAFITLSLPSFDNQDSGTGSCKITK